MLSCWAHEEECDNKIDSSFFFSFFFPKIKVWKNLWRKFFFTFFSTFIFIFFENKFLHPDEIGCSQCVMKVFSLCLHGVSNFNLYCRGQSNPFHVKVEATNDQFPLDVVIPSEIMELCFSEKLPTDGSEHTTRQAKGHQLLIIWNYVTTSDHLQVVLRAPIINHMNKYNLGDVERLIVSQIKVCRKYIPIEPLLT